MQFPGGGSAAAVDWTRWEPHTIAQAVWDDRLVDDEAKRIPLKANLHQHPRFADIFTFLSNLIDDRPSATSLGKYKVYFLERKRSDCESKDLTRPR
jgi:hypothetical protein